MSTTTALQLVNRFLRRYRYPDVSDFSSPEALAALDLLNEAAQEVLETRDWSFNQREGVLETLPYYASGGTSSVFTNGSQISLSTDGTSGATLSGSHTLRAVSSSSSDRAQTALAVSGVSIVAGILQLRLSENYSGASIAGTGTVDLLAAEYQWPAHSNGDSYVLRLLSMYHQERPLRLVEIDKNFRFDSLITRLHDSVASDPEVVYVGRQIRSTGTYSTSPTTTLRDGCIVWPVAENAEHLNYTYLYRHSVLAATTDTFDSVPENVLNCIVELAHGFSLNTMFGNDPVKAERVIRAATTRAERLHQADRKTPHRKKPLRSLDEKSREYQTGRRISSDLITGY